MYWDRKIAGNQARDRLVTMQLRKEGWTVIRIWEHAVKDNPLKCIGKVVESVKAAKARAKDLRS